MTIARRIRYLLFQPVVWIVMAWSLLFSTPKILRPSGEEESDY